MEKFSKLLVMELDHEFWSSTKSIFQHHHKKITLKFAIVGFSKKKCHDNGFLKMAFSKSVKKRFKNG